MPFSVTRASIDMHAPLRRAARALLLLVTLSSLAAAQDRGCTSQRPRVEGLRISGNRSISESELRSIIFTERAGKLRRWFGWNVGTPACLDSTEMAKDARRIALWYERRGYPGTTATAAFERKNDRTATVSFGVREAPPVRMDTVRIEGLPGNVVNQRALRERLLGEPLDTAMLRVTVDSVQRDLRAAGYVRARAPDFTTTVDSARRRAQVALRFDPGALVRVGRIDIAMTANDSGNPAISEQDVRTLLRIKPGDVFRADSVGESQQVLFGSGVYRLVAIDSAASGAAGDTIPVVVRVVEGRHHSLRSGAGWGTIDCFRTQTRYTQQNFLGRAHRLQLDARLSRIGVGEPLDGFSTLCAPGVRRDAFSAKLNYHGGATVQLRGVLGDAWHPQLTLYSERRTEFESYVRETTIGALASVERPIIPRVSTVFEYRYDNGQTTSDQAVACAVFGLCRFLDRLQLLEPSTMHAAGVTFSRSAPSLGTVVVNDNRWAVETRLGTLDVGDPGIRVNFSRTQLEYAIYRPLSNLFVGAARVQAGAVVTRRDLEPLVPPQERFYSGGQNTVRGFGQNQLGPAVYIVDEPQDAVVRNGVTVREARAADGFNRLAPAGGTATALLNLELRTRVGWPSALLRWVLFLDAGRVWNNTGSYTVSGLRFTPGLGVRLMTPLGPFRVDVGYNDYPYEAGPAFYLLRADPAQGIEGRAICVSPGTIEEFSLPPGATPAPVGCPTSFRPPRTGGLFPRLAFHFSIGEAF